MKRDVKHTPLRTLKVLQKKELLRRFAAKAWTRNSAIRLRRLQAKDRGEIMRLLEDAGVFSDREIKMAISLVDQLLQGNPDYRFLVATDAGDTVLGYICYGHNPLTAGTWDIYWVAVSRRFQRRHVGSLLIEGAEKDIGGEEGKLIVIETSSKPSYRPTRKFYERMGYRISARIEKFYSESDDMIIYSKYFAT